MKVNSQNQSGFSAIEALLIVIIISIVGFTGYYVWHGKKNVDKNLSATQSTITTKRGKTISPTAKPTQSYTNDSLGFTVAYPGKWKVANSDGEWSSSPEEAAVFFISPDYTTTSNPKGDTITAGGEFVITRHAREANTTIDEMDRAGNFEKSTNITVDGIKAVKHTCDSSIRYNSACITLIKDNHLWMIIYSNDGKTDYSAAFNAFVQSFKFQ